MDGGVNDDMMNVLRHLAEHFATPGVQGLNTPFDVPGLSFDDRIAPVLRRLMAADPPYIRGATVDQADYPVLVTALTERGWEAAKAAGDARDAAPGGPASIPLPAAITPSGRTFQVALSFASEQRAYVQRVASALAALGIQCFYDEEQKISLWGKNQVEELQRIYMDDSFAVVMFISSEYAKKTWPIHERQATLSRAIRERREYILPVRFDDALLPGFDRDVSYLKADDFAPEVLAAAIAVKLVALGGAVPAVSGSTAGWARAAAGRRSTDMTITFVDDSGQSVAGARVLAVAHNGTYVDAVAGSGGVASLQLPARRLVTLYAAHSTTAAVLVLTTTPRTTSTWSYHEPLAAAA